jgi:hypothetical protein
LLFHDSLPRSNFDEKTRRWAFSCVPPLDLEAVTSLKKTLVELLAGKSWADSVRNFYFLAFPCFSFGRLSGCCLQLLGVLHGIPRVLVSLLAEFVSSLMICFAVSDCCNGVGVRCQIMKFCGLIVRTLWHGVSLSIQDAKSSARSHKNRSMPVGYLPMPGF